MKTGIVDSKKELHELPFYEVEGLCRFNAESAAELNEEYKIKLEEYRKQITRFSPEVEFCLHELGWMLYDPFCTGKEEVIFSNGERCYLASLAYVSAPDFDRKKVVNPQLGYGRLFDEEIGYKKELTPDMVVTEGIIDELGYVDSKFARGLEELANIENTYKMLGDKDTYLDYMRNKDTYATTLEYVTSKKNVISAKKLEDGTISLAFVSENDGKVQDFIDTLAVEDKIADLAPIVAFENRSIQKAA